MSWSHALASRRTSYLLATDTAEKLGRLVLNTYRIRTGDRELQSFANCCSVPFSSRAVNEPLLARGGSGAAIRHR